MAMARQRAHEFCSCVHLEKKTLGAAVASEIAAMLGLPEQDRRWCTPWGLDVTHFCDISTIGGFASVGWSIRGWILDHDSVIALNEELKGDSFEIPEYYLGRICRT